MSGNVLPHPTVPITHVPIRDPSREFHCRVILFDFPQGKRFGTQGEGSIYVSLGEDVTKGFTPGSSVVLVVKILEQSLRVRGRVGPGRLRLRDPRRGSSDLLGRSTRTSYECKSLGDGISDEITVVERKPCSISLTQHRPRVPPHRFRPSDLSSNPHRPSTSPETQRACGDDDLSTTQTREGKSWGVGRFGGNKEGPGDVTGVLTRGIWSTREVRQEVHRRSHSNDFASGSVQSDHRRVSSVCGRRDETKGKEFLRSREGLCKVT